MFFFWTGLFMKTIQWDDSKIFPNFLFQIKYELISCNKILKTFLTHAPTAKDEITESFADYFKRYFIRFPIKTFFTEHTKRLLQFIFAPSTWERSWYDIYFAAIQLCTSTITVFWFEGQRPRGNTGNRDVPSFISGRRANTCDR